ncbi:hypothetical protein JAAARDRAFT_59122 [Jaapia argillacea MUCL 33604]|uniref:Uncharacterized protein n=1 Tax=Jaapia argillacea MUCL 33604 TaxID=933084 RepID=A0A067PSV0_9AGAM|nr:hypothetical protein JAAARDRAFT_59122 [Jaapia argillacea MUCL 33604]
MPATWRKSVPSGLHNELTEYASLLRALRTSSTLDLASQLTTQRRASHGHESDVSLSDDPMDGDEMDRSHGSGDVHAAGSSTAFEPDLQVDSRSATSIRTTSTSKKRKRTDEVNRREDSSLTTSSSRSKDRDRDTWTRWPLLAGDVHIPEWGLEDEVKLLALQELKVQRQGNGDPGPTPATPEDDRTLQQGTDGIPMDIDSVVNDQDSEDEDTTLPPSALNGLILSSSSHLSQLLSALSAHFPLAEKSMQNRVKPIGWETVLDVVGVSGLVDEKSIDSVRRGMEAIYGPAQSHASSRAESASLAKRKLDDFLAKQGHEFSILDFGGPPDEMKRKENPKRGKKAKEALDEETAPEMLPK